MNRREVIKGLGTLAALIAAPRLAFAAKRERTLNILFMGGTGFIGPHMVRALRERRHRLTLFNRGRTNPDLFPDLELIKGDRLTDDIRQLRGRQWDVVIDTSAFFPRAVVSLLNQLELDSLQQYLFISTISVYANFAVPGIDETAPKETLPEPDTEDVSRFYGALKYASEQAARRTLPGRVLAIRPGMIVGPGDPTDRFTYWPEHVARRGRVLAPGNPTDPIQTMDARDLADWVVRCVEDRILGEFNATSDTGETFGSMLSACQSALNPEAELVWLPHEFLLEQGVQEWSDLPFWVNPGGDLGGAWRVNTDRARAAGLRHRPLRDTIVDLHAWFKTLPLERRNALKAGMSAEREAEVLAAWDALAQSGK